MDLKAAGSSPAYLHLDGSEMGDLVADLIARGAAVRFVALGGSMSPWIRGGDVVTLSPGAAKLGRIVAFRRAETRRLTVHRLVRRVSGGWVARGDRAAAEDGVVADEGILGVVTRVERNGKLRFLPGGVVGVWLAQLSRLALEARAWGRCRSAPR